MGASGSAPPPLLVTSRMLVIGPRILKTEAPKANLLNKNQLHSGKQGVGRGGRATADESVGPLQNRPSIHLTEYAVQDRRGEDDYTAPTSHPSFQRNIYLGDTWGRLICGRWNALARCQTTSIHWLMIDVLVAVTGGVLLSFHLSSVSLTCFFQPLHLPNPGLRYEDLLNEDEKEVKEALALADPEVQTARTRRLKRAIDLSYKRKSLQDYAPDMDLELFKKEIYVDIEKIRARDQEFAQLNAHNKQ